MFGRNGRFIVSHSYYPDLVVSDNNDSWILLQDVFAVNGFQPNNIVAGGGTLLAAADDAKVIYRSLDSGLTWAQVATGIAVTDVNASPQVKVLDQILALAYGPDGATNVFFMLARRNDVTRYRYLLTSPDGVTWTQRLRIDLGTTGTPQEPLIAASPSRVIVLWNNLTTATTITTTTSAATWTQVTSTPAANWRTLVYDGNKFVAAGEPFGVVSAPIVMTMVPTTPQLVWNVKLTGTQKLRAAAAGQSAPIPLDGAVSLLLRMTGTAGSSSFIDSSNYPKQVTATGATLSDEQTKWPGTLSALFGTNKYLAVTGNPDIAMGTDDFTIEAWVWLKSGNWRSPLWESNPLFTSDHRPNGFVFYYHYDGSLRLYRQGSDIIVTAANIIPLATWSHIALVRKNSKTTIYVDGDAKGSTTATFNDTAAAGGALIGQFCVPSGWPLDGYIGEFRITKGAALYDGQTFSVPASPFSVSVAIVGDPRNISFSPAVATQININWRPPYTSNGIDITDYEIQYSIDDGETWVAATTTVKTKIDATVVDLTDGVTYRFRVAAITDAGLGPYSEMSTAVVPGPDPYFDYVSLLLKFNTADNAFVDASSDPKALFVPNTVTQGGYLVRPNAVSLSNTQSRWGDGSAFFNNGQLGTLEASTALGFGTGDFTIEFWAFPLWNPAGGALMVVGDPFSGIWLAQNDWLLMNGWSYSWNSQKLPANVWTHIALVREAGYVSMYANGLRILNFEQPVDLGASQSVMIGDRYAGELREPFIGYLDDLRITKGVARYSGGSVQIPTGPF